MNGLQLRLAGACVILFVLIVLLSGWSALFAPEALLSTLLEAGLLVLGLALVYQGENLRAAQAKY